MEDEILLQKVMVEKSYSGEAVEQDCLNLTRIRDVEINGNTENILSTSESSDSIKVNSKAKSLTSR